MPLFIRYGALISWRNRQLFNLWLLSSMLHSKRRQPVGIPLVNGRSLSQARSSYRVIDLWDLLYFRVFRSQHRMIKGLRIFLLWVYLEVNAWYRCSLSLAKVQLQCSIHSLIASPSSTLLQPLSDINPWGVWLPRTTLFQGEGDFGIACQLEARGFCCSHFYL